MDKIKMIGTDTINTSSGTHKNISIELPIPNKIVSPFTIKKPTIIFYEPSEIMITETTTYLQETKITKSELLEKYDIDYDSFLYCNIRDEKGLPEILKSQDDIHEFILKYISN